MKNRNGWHGQTEIATVFGKKNYETKYSSSTNDYTYDEAGQLSFFGNGRLRNFYFNQGDYLVDSTYYNSSNQVQMVTKIKYEGKTPLEFLEYLLVDKLDDSGDTVVLTKKVIYDYNRHNDLITWERQDFSLSQETREKEHYWEYQYDAENNWIEKKEYRDGKLYHTEERVITYYKRKYLGILP